MCQLGALVPRVGYCDTSCLEIDTFLVTGHAMNERSCCDKRSPIGTEIWHMQRCASLGHSSVNRQNSRGECRQYVTVDPGPRNRALLPVTAFDE